LINLTFSNRTERILEDGGDSIAPPPRPRVGGSLLPAKPILASTSCARRADQSLAESASSADESGVAKPAEPAAVVAPAVAAPVAEPAVVAPAVAALVAEPAVVAPAVAAPVAEPAVVAPAVAAPVAEPAVVAPAVAEPAVAEPAVADVAKPAIVESAVTIVDQSSVADPAVNESVFNHMDQDLQHDNHFPSPALPPRTPSPQSRQGASRTEGGIFRGYATGNAVDMADIDFDEQPADHRPRNDRGKILFFTSRDPNARPHLSMRHLVTPSLHSILSDLSDEFSPVRSTLSAELY